MIEGKCPEENTFPGYKTVKTNTNPGECANWRQVILKCNNWWSFPTKQKKEGKLSYLSVLYISVQTSQDKAQAFIIWEWVHKSNQKKNTFKANKILGNDWIHQELQTHNHNLLYNKR